MSLASAQTFLSTMKSDEAFRAEVTSLPTQAELVNFLQIQGYDFALPDLIKAMAACMAGLEQCGVQ